MLPWFEAFVAEGFSALCEREREKKILARR